MGLGYSYNDTCGNSGADLTILIFVWESQSADKGKEYHVGVFDLNRWYYAQMPRNIRWERAIATASMVTEQVPKICSFLAFHSLGTAVEEAGEPLMVSCCYYKIIRKSKYIMITTLTPNNCA